MYADLPDTWNQILYTQLLKSIGSLGVDQWGNMSPDSLLIATELTFLSYDIPLPLLIYKTELLPNRFKKVRIYVLLSNFRFLIFRTKQY